jgi:hypothetical protein
MKCAMKCAMKSNPQNVQTPTCGRQSALAGGENERCEWKVGMMAPNDVDGYSGQDFRLTLAMASRATSRARACWTIGSG